MAHPQLFAAIAPCCGGMPWNAKVLTMPIWVFHGLQDKTATPNNTLEMVNALTDINPNLKCTIYENAANNLCAKAYSHALLQWFLSQHK